MACRILMGIDVVVALVFVFFVVVGLADGSVSWFDVASWLAALGTLAGALLGGAKLHAAGKRAAAACVLEDLLRGTCLADPRLARDQHEAAAPVEHLVGTGAQRSEQRIAPDQGVARPRPRNRHGHPGATPCPWERSITGRLASPAARHKRSGTRSRSVASLRAP